MSRLIPKIPVALLVIAFFAIESHGLGLLGQSASAEESVAVGLKPGDPIGTFRVIKIAGSDDDGVEVGQSLCYRCRYGSSPIVMVFARKTSEQLDPLISVLEKALEAHESKKLNAFVIAVGDDRSKLNNAAAALIERTGAKRIPAVVTEDSTSGPLDYQLSSASDVTIVVAKDSQVVAIEISSIDKVQPKAIVKHIDTMLRQ